MELKISSPHLAVVYFRLFLSAFGQATVDGAINFSAASAADIAGAGGTAAAYLQPLVAAATAAGTASTAATLGQASTAEVGGGGLFLPGPAAAGIGPDGLPCQPDLPGIKLSNYLTHESVSRHVMLSLSFN